jgi:hypothetical protein
VEEFVRVATQTASSPSLHPLSRLLLPTICGFVLVGILMAGLWPFHAPRNDVDWLDGGLQFGQHGSIVSANSFKRNATDKESPCSLEIWLRPLRDNYSGTILAFYQPETLTAPFRLRQSLGDLAIDRADVGSSGRDRTNRIYVDDLFRTPGLVFVSITSGAGGTTVYADGMMVRRYDKFRFSIQDLTGQLIVGNTPATTDLWRGLVKGVAIFERELSAAEVAADYTNQTKAARTAHPDGEGLVARYRFDEGQGSVVHNQVDSTTNLVIPERFFVLRARLLEPFWEEFHGTWSYWENIGVNIGGFIPLGFFFCAYFTLVWRMERAAAVTVALGFLVCLTIEVSQSFLPSRDSGTTDLFTNTLGTWIGVMAYHHWLVQTNVTRVTRVES